MPIKTSKLYHNICQNNLNIFFFGGGVQKKLRHNHITCADGKTAQSVTSLRDLKVGGELILPFPPV